MKKIFAIAALLTSTQLFAYSTYVAKEHTCSQLKNAISAEGKILIKGPWIFSRFLYSDASACGSFEKPITTNWKVKNGRCNLRWACERDNSHDR